MDTLTHIVVGACIGEVMLGKRLGKRAMLLGAIAQSVPDIDFIGGFWLNPAQDIVAHRALTHSVLFALVMSLLLGWLSEKLHRDHDISLKKWIRFFLLQINLHLFLDSFNAYGTGLFEPFTHYRVSFNALFVADPLFSLWPGISFLVLLILKRANPKRRLWAITGLLLPAFYLCICIVNKLSVDKEIKNIAAKQNISYKNYFTTPTPLNNLLWYAVLQNDSGYYIGYRSVFDRKQSIEFTFFLKNDSLLQNIRSREDVKNLLQFSNDFYTVEKWNDTLVLNELKFGQVIGWKDQHAHFAFHYFLNRPDDNKLVVQRGRFANWDKAAVKAFIKKIKGE